MAGPSDELGPLLAATAGGDRAAFRRLYDLTAPKLLGVVARIVRDRAVAEDVVQEAYLRIWGAAGRYAPEAGEPMTWLVAIARHRAIDLMRRRTEAPAPATADGSDWLASVPEERDRAAEIADRASLAACLERLDEAQRSCFLLAYQDGYSREELAARFDRPVNTIKTWLHRSAQVLRTCLDEG